MKIDEIKVGETYAARPRWGTVSAVKVLAIERVPEWPNYNRSRLIRRPLCEFQRDGKTVTEHVKPQDFLGPWSEHAERVERIERAERDRADAMERLAQALPDAEIHRSGLRHISLLLTPYEARELAARLNEAP